MSWIFLHWSSVKAKQGCLDGTIAVHWEGTKAFVSMLEGVLPTGTSGRFFLWVIVDEEDVCEWISVSFPKGGVGSQNVKSSVFPLSTKVNQNENQRILERTHMSVFELCPSSQHPPTCVLLPSHLEMH